MGFYGLAASLLVVWSIAVGAVAYSKGSASRNPEISELQAAIKASEVLAAEASDRAAKASARVVTVYKDRIKTIREVTPGEIQFVDRVIREADPSCVLPPSYRVLWDNGPAAGSKAPEGSAGTDGPPVTVAELTEATVEARRRFDENSARLEALQELIKSQ